MNKKQLMQSMLVLASAGAILNSNISLGANLDINKSSNALILSLKSALLRANVDVAGTEGAENYEYTVNSDNTTVTITKYKGSAINLIIPSTIEGKTVTAIDNILGEDSITTTITIPASVTSIDNYPDSNAPFAENKNLKEIIVDSNNTVFASENGVLFSKDKTILLKYPPAKDGTIYSIAGNVVKIHKKAFKNATKLVEINFQYKEGTETFSVNFIGSEAFLNCSSLKDFRWPSTTTTINAATFAGCTGLKSIYIPNKVTSINTSSATGVFAFCSGDLIIICSDDTKAQEYAEQYNITYTSTRVESVAIKVGEKEDVKELNLNKEESKQFEAVISPDDAILKRVKWSSSNEAVATVNETGVVTAVGAGEAEIYAISLDRRKKATCKVSVYVPVKSVSLNKTNLTMGIGQSEYLGVTVNPSDAMNKKVTWNCSNPEVVSLSDNGVITALSTGTAKITVTTEEGNMTATCDIIVKESVTGVKLNKLTTTINKGDIETLVAIVSPTNADNTKVIWSSSNESVVTVNNSGVVTAVGKGTAIITVTTVDGNKMAGCVVTVNVPVTEVSLNKTNTTINKGATETLTATVNPSDVSNAKVTWSSSNTAVATVNSSGVVTAVGKGTATITVTTEDGNKTASCDVTVNVPVTAISLNKTNATINKGETETLTATVNPSDVSNAKVTWSSSNKSVATVNSSGVVTAVGKGTATITVTTEDGNKTASCEITVNVPVIGVSLNKTSTTISKGITETLVATINPSDASNTKVTWSSSNKSVVTVNSSGVVTAVGKGTATITVTTEDGNKTANCNVTVEEKVNSSSYEIDETNKVIKSIPANTTAKEFLKEFDGLIKDDNVELDDNDIIGTGFKLVRENGTIYTLIVSGDVNGDGKVTATDLLKIKRNIIKTENLDKYQIQAGDLNESGSITATDLLQIKRKIIGL